MPAHVNPTRVVERDIRILLVEDDPDVGPLLEHVLLSAGFKVHMTSSLTEAQELLDSRTYDIVLADVMLPDGSGLKIADAAKARGIRAIVVTAYPFQIPLDYLARHEVLQKPVRPNELVDAIERGPA